MSATADPLSGLSVGGDGPVFREPWEAHAFALAVTLHERGLFSWSEWAAVLGAEIQAAASNGPPPAGQSAYQPWLRTLERLVAQKGASDAGELERYRLAWEKAAGRTAHGQPIELTAADLATTRDSPG